GFIGHDRTVSTPSLWSVPELAFFKGASRCMIKCAFYVGINYPLLGFVGSSQFVDLPKSVVTASAWTKSVARALKPGFPSWLKSIFDHCLKAAIHHDGYP